MLPLFLLTACSSVPVSEKQEPLIDNGIYRITDESWKEYVLNYSKDIEVTDEWLQNAIDEGDTAEWSQIVRPRNYLYCTIAQNQISLSIPANYVYHIKKDTDVFRCEPLNKGKDISFSLSGELLNVRFNEEETYRFERIAFKTEEKFTTLAAPSEIEITQDDNGMTMMWNYRSGYGEFGVAAEVKPEGNEQYYPVRYASPYKNAFVLQFSEDDFQTGENLLRLYHVGGPCARKDNTIEVFANSSYLIFKVTLTESGFQVAQVL